MGALKNPCKMERKFSYAELVSFGNYLLSKERDQSITSEFLKDEVNHADIANWSEKEGITLEK